jgi:MFS family permease
VKRAARHCVTHRQQHKTCELKPLHIAVLLVALAAVSIAYSAVLPVLPFLIERMGGITDSGLIATHTGLLTATYTLAIAIGAPQWGKRCDRMGSRRIIIIGLTGLASTLALFSFFENLTLIYLGRFLAGLFASAVPPAAMTAVSRYKASDEWKARRLSWIGLALIAGAMIGPLFGGLAVRLAERSVWMDADKFALAAPFLLAAVIAVVAVVLILTIFPSRYSDERCEPAPAEAPSQRQAMLLRLLILAFIAALGISSFHVLLTIRSKEILGFDSYQIGLMFSECSLVMFMVQAIVFSPLVKPANTRYLIVPAFALMIAGLVTMPYSNSFPTMLLSTGSVAAGVGVVAPVLIYWISLIAGARKGESLGKQVSAASFGETSGAVVSGLLFGYAAAPFLPFLVIGLLILAALALSLRLPAALHPFMQKSH